MDPSSITPPPFVTSKSQKYSRIGNASFVIGILVSLLLLCFMCNAIISGSNESQSNMTGTFGWWTTFLIIFLGLLIIVILSLVGIGLGIGALVQKQDDNLLGILGLVLNAFFILVFAIMLLLGKMTSLVFNTTESFWG